MYLVFSLITEKNCLIFVTILSYNRFTILGMDIKVRILLPL